MAVDGKPTGPYSIEKLKEMIISGQLTPSSLLWKTGMKEWVKADTIEKTYEVAIAFKTVVYSDKGFKYYNYTNFSDVQELNDFIENCRKLEFYNTGIDINYGDKLITLSTCEYSQKNGRIVVVAKQI